MRDIYSSPLFRARDEALDQAATIRRAAAAQRKATAASRLFQAASINRLTASFSSINSSINADLEGQLATLRGRSRNAYSNFPLARRAAKLAGRNIVGPNGFKIQSKAVDYRNRQPVQDVEANRAIVAHHQRWSRPEFCDVAGRLSFPHMCRNAIEGCAREGEALIRKVRDRKFEYGIKFQLLDIDRLDEKYNAKLQNGNLIRMGVEIATTGEVVALHLYSEHPFDTRGGIKITRERVPASEIYHIFLQDRPEQVRGYPWSHAILSRLNQLDGFQDAAVVAARVGASKMGFFTTPDGDGASLADEGEDVDGDGEPEYYTDAEPGKFGVLPEGSTFTPFDPDYPHQFFDPFVKAISRELAVGQGIAYHNLTGDMTGVNYSSARIDELGERDEWAFCQNWFAGVFVWPSTRDWLEAALIKRALTLPFGGTLPAEKFAKYEAGLRVNGRRWTWVDPKNDVQAQVLAIDNKLKSRTAVITEQGGDIDETFEDLAHEEDRLEELGLNTSPADAGAPSKVTNAEPDDETDDA